MTYTEELQQKKEKLGNLIPQLIDLKQGFLPELTLKKGENADLLMETITNKIDAIDTELKLEALKQ